MKIRKLKKQYKHYVILQFVDEIYELYLALRNWNRSKKLKPNSEIYFLKELHRQDLKEICKQIEHEVITGKQLIKWLKEPTDFNEE